MNIYSIFKVLAVIIFCNSSLNSQNMSIGTIGDNPYPESNSLKKPISKKINIETISLIDSILSFSGECKSLHKYSYDANYNIVEILNMNFGCNYPYEDTREIYSLDSNGYIIEELREYLDGSGSAINFDISYYRYDNDYNIISKKDSSREGFVRNEYFTYNDFDLIVDYSSSVSNSSFDYFEVLDISYYYNNINQILKIDGESSYSAEGSGGGSFWSKSYIYDSLSNLIEYNSNFYEENGFNAYGEYSKVLYYYDSNNQRISEVGKSYNSEWGELQDSIMWQYDYEYYSDNNLKYSTYSIFDTTLQINVNNKRIFYEYDSNNNQTLILEEFWNSEWVNGNKIKYEYDSEGNCLSGISETWDESSWIPNNKIIGFSDSDDAEYNFNCEEFLVYYSDVTTVEEKIILSKNFELTQNYPNPFNPNTTIKYSIPVEEIITNSKFKSVVLRVYDVLGKEVSTLVNKNQKPGNYKVEFDGSSLSSGIYFYRLQATPSGGQADGYVETKKMILLK